MKLTYFRVLALEPGVYNPALGFGWNLIHTQLPNPGDLISYSPVMCVF